MLVRLESGYAYDPMYGQLCNERDQLKAENAKLRKLVRDWRELAVCGADSLSDWIEIQADLESRMRELGIEVDGCA